MLQPNFSSLVNAVDAASATTCYITMVTAATGLVQIKTDTGLTYNASTDVLTAAGFAGGSGSGGLSFGSNTGDVTLPTGALTWAGASGKAGAIGSTGAGLTLSTTTSGTLAVTSAGAVNHTSAAASTWTHSGGAFAINSTSQSITISTLTSGTLALVSAGALNHTSVAASTWTHSGGAFAINSTSQAITIQTITSGTLTITSAGTLALDGTSITFGHAPQPSSNDGAALGVASTGEWSDAFFASGAVLKFANADTITHSSGAFSFGTAAVTVGALTATGTVSFTYAAGSGLLEKTSTAGGVGSCQSIVKNLTALADGGSGTTLFTVTVPNINCGAAFLIVLTASIGDDTTLNYDSTDVVLYTLAVSRISGANTVNNLSAVGVRATTTGAVSTRTCAATLVNSGLAGGATAQQTFNVRVVVTPSGGTYGKNIAMGRITCLNEIASGITIA